MKIVQYKDEELKKELRAVDVESLLGDMEDLEAFNGTYNPEKVAEAYYVIKRELLNALAAEIKEEKK